jgi:hypothetical protein
MHGCGVDRPVERIWFSADAATLHAHHEAGSVSWRMPDKRDFQPPARLPDAEAAKPKPAFETPPPAAADSVTDREVVVDVVGRTGRRALLVCGQRTRAGCTRSIELWEGGALHAELPYEPVFDRDLAAFLQFAGNDDYLVIGTRTGLEIVERQSLEPVGELFHAGAILVGVSTKFRRAATMDRSGSVRVWDLTNGTEVVRLESAEKAVALALSNDERWLALLTAAGNVDLYALGVPDLVNQACRWLDPPCP